MSAYDLLQVYASQFDHATSEMEELGDADDNTTETPSNTPSDDAYTGLSMLLLLLETVDFHQVTFVVSFWKLPKFLSTYVNI
jgi:hypothetical protein